MIHRACALPLTPEAKSKELATIKQIARNNNFPIKVINKIIDQKNRQMMLNEIYPHNPETERNTYITLPYINLPSERVGNIFKKFKISPAFRNSKSLGNLIFNAKTKTAVLNKSGVYKLTCPDSTCSATYVGQTGRSFKTRYQAQINPKSIHSNFSQHLIEKDHKISGAHTPEILHLQSKGKLLDLLETLEINRIAKNSTHTVLNDQLDLSSSPLLNLFNITPT